MSSRLCAVAAAALVWFVGAAGAAPAQSNPASTGFAPRIKGITQTAWWFDEYGTAESDAALADLARTGANWVGFISSWYMESGGMRDGSRASRLFPHRLKTPSDESLAHAIRRARRLGLAVMLKLHVRVVRNAEIEHWEDTWAGTIEPADREAWFDSYIAFATHYAALAQAEGVALFVFGNELNTMTNPSLPGGAGAANTAGWKRVIDAIRGPTANPNDTGDFAGELTYSATVPDEYRWVPFWDRCAYLGVAPYFSLSPAGIANPALDDLMDGWRNSVEGGDVVGGLQSWSEAHGNKPVLFTEIGYNSIDAGTYHPFGGTQTVAENWELQTRAYDALALTFFARPWFAGLFWWNWLPHRGAGTSGADRKEFTPQGKPALGSLTRSFRSIDPAAVRRLEIVAGTPKPSPADPLAVGASRFLYAVGFDRSGASLGFVPARWAIEGQAATLVGDEGAVARVFGAAPGRILLRVELAPGGPSAALRLKVERVRH